MNNNVVQKVLIKAVGKILNPILNMWMSKGLSYVEFSKLTRQIFVKMAKKQIQEKNEEATYSRVAVITGLTRQMVTNLSKASVDDIIEDDNGNRATKILSYWLIDEDFLTDRGKPSQLSTGPKLLESQFAKLVKRYAGDIPVKTVLEELISIRAIEYVNQYDVKLITKGYTPNKDISELIRIVGEDTSDLLQTMNHNITTIPEERFFQKKVFHDGISSEELEAIRLFTKQKSQKLLEDIYKDLSQYGKSKRKNKENIETGIGVFYYEKNLNEDNNE